MCGVVGYKGKKTPFSLGVFKELLVQSQIRGKHATGISYVLNGVIKTIKEPIPAEDFISYKTFGELTISEEEELTIIGHCRYSTSDLEYNQPIADEKLAIAHNGVITQSSPEFWEEQYNYRCATKNDSELLFHTLKNRLHPLFEFQNASIACCAIENNDLMFFRNGQRPLWYFKLKDGIFVASTKDILLRTFREDYGFKKCNPNSVYIFDSKLKEIRTDSPIVKDLQIETKIQSYYKKIKI